MRSGRLLTAPASLPSPFNLNFPGLLTRTAATDVDAGREYREAKRERPFRGPSSGKAVLRSVRAKMSATSSGYSKESSECHLFGTSIRIGPSLQFCQCVRKFFSATAAHGPLPPRTCATARPQLAKADTAFQGASVGQPTEPCLVRPSRGSGEQYHGAIAAATRPTITRAAPSRVRSGP
jgi:hypothetical protein